MSKLIYKVDMTLLMTRYTQTFFKITTRIHLNLVLISTSVLIVYIILNELFNIPTI